MRRNDPSNEALVTWVVCSTSVGVEKTIFFPLTEAKVLPI